MHASFALQFPTKIIVFFLFNAVLFSINKVHAAILIGVEDSYGIPLNEPLVVEALGVLENDTLDGENGAVAVLILLNWEKTVINE